MRCWTQPLVCIRSTWADQSQTRPDKGVSLAFPQRSAHSKNIQNPGTQTPTLHKMKARQNASRDYPFSLHKETIVCLYTPSLPGFANLYSIKKQRKRKATWQRRGMHAVYLLETKAANVSGDFCILQSTFCQLFQADHKKLTCRIATDRDSTACVLHWWHYIKHKMTY